MDEGGESPAVRSIGRRSLLGKLARLAGGAAVTGTPFAAIAADALSPQRADRKKPTLANATPPSPTPTPKLPEAHESAKSTATPHVVETPVPPTAQPKAVETPKQTETPKPTEILISTDLSVIHVTPELKAAFPGNEKKQTIAAFVSHIMKDKTMPDEKLREYLLKTADVNYSLVKTLLGEPSDDMEKRDQYMDDVATGMAIAAEQIIVLQKNVDVKRRIEKTGKPEWTKMREVAGKVLNYNKESPIYKLHQGLVFVETGGEPPPGPNAAGAMGLCQVKQDAGNDVARDLKGNAHAQPFMKYLDTEKTQPNLLDAQTNVLASLEYLDTLKKLYKDNGMAFWAYHAGPGNMAIAVGTHIGLDWSDVKELQMSLAGLHLGQEASEAQVAIINYIKTHDLNFVRLLTSDAVKKRFSEAEITDDTFFYVPRILAGMIFMSAGTV
jgi:hypothetical protein